MSSVVSRLGPERERQLKKQFPQAVNFFLLYKGSHHGFNINTLRTKSGNQGRFVLIVYVGNGLVYGGYLSKQFPEYNKQFQDPDAFVFCVTERDAWRFGGNNCKNLFSELYSSLCFGKGLQLSAENGKIYVTSKFDGIDGEICTLENTCCVEVEVHRVQDAGDILPCPWREMTWTEKNREELREDLVSFKPTYGDLSKVQVLLLGPTGAGKSSFINSVKSVMYRRVSHMPIIGSAPEGFTKKLKSYHIRAEKGGQPTALTLCDVTGFGDSNGTGLTYKDTLEVIKGHVPEGYKFQSEDSINILTAGYCISPTMKDRIHCAVFVLDACEVHQYRSTLEQMLKDLRRKISDLEIPHVVLLTHVDQVCPAVSEDVQYVYTRRIVLERMEKAAELLGLPVSSVLPVKNYSSEHSVNCNTDILLLSALNHMLQAIQDTFEDYPPPPKAA